jgi:hypothetical protein
MHSSRKTKTLWLGHLALLLAGLAVQACGAEREFTPQPAAQLEQALVNAVQVRVAASADDAEESSAGAVVLTSTDLELVNDGAQGNQRVGMRFRNVQIPRGATVLSAAIDFAVDETGGTATSVIVRAEATDSAAVFTTQAGNIASRSLTSSQVSWAPPAWNSEGQTQTSPDLAAVVQELVNRAGWAPGNNVAFVITGSGRRTAEAFDGVPALAPLLKVSYEPQSACGDATCNGSETCTSCAQDCGACPPPPPAPACGDAACNGGETCSTCAPDCGACPVTSIAEARVASSADDAEESSTGAMSLTSTDMELVNDGSRGDQRVGLRFSNLSVPQGAAIRDAYVVFVTDEAKTAAAQVTVRAQAIDSAPVFTTANNNVSSRSSTGAQVPWSMAAWSTIGQAVQSPSLTALVQEVVSRPGWRPGNALALLITGTGVRTASAFDGAPGQAALLHVVYEGTPPAAAVCGNGACDGGESCYNCPTDCGSHAAPGVTRFAVVGDFGMDNAAEAAVATMVGCWNPEFIITTGDNNYPSGTAAKVDNAIGQYYSKYIGSYRGNYGPGSATNRFWPTLGNHDWETSGATPYVDYFAMPGKERYYDADLGPVHLYSVDSDPHEPDGTNAASLQASWLQARLAASTSCWDVVFFHHAAYVSGSHHGSALAMRWPFEAWGADTVLAGHEHLYERLQVGAIPYFVNGLGGADLYPFAPTPLTQSVVRYNGSHGAMLMEAQGGTLTTSFYSVDGVRRDQYTSTKSCP